MMPYFPDWIVVLPEPELITVGGVAGQCTGKHDAGAGCGRVAGATWQDGHVYVTARDVN